MASIYLFMFPQRQNWRLFSGVCLTFIHPSSTWANTLQPLMAWFPCWWMISCNSLTTGTLTWNLISLFVVLRGWNWLHDLISQCHQCQRFHLTLPLEFTYSWHARPVFITALTVQMPSGSRSCAAQVFFKFVCSFSVRQYFVSSG